jgi:hypothetical protein
MHPLIIGFGDVSALGDAEEDLGDRGLREAHRDRREQQRHNPNEQRRPRAEAHAAARVRRAAG